MANFSVAIASLTSDDTNLLQRSPCARSPNFRITSWLCTLISHYGTCISRNNAVKRRSWVKCGGERAIVPRVSLLFRCYSDPKTTTPKHRLHHSRHVRRTAIPSGMKLKSCLFLCVYDRTVRFDGTEYAGASKLARKCVLCCSGKLFLGMKSFIIGHLGVPCIAEPCEQLSFTLTAATLLDAIDFVYSSLLTPSALY